MSPTSVCGADRYGLPGPTWQRLTCDLPAGHDGKHHNELFDWPRADSEPRVTAGEHIVSSHDTAAVARAAIEIRANFEKVLANVQSALSAAPEQLAALNGWFGDMTAQPPHVRRAGWYPRKPKGARP